LARISFVSTRSTAKSRGRAELGSVRKLNFEIEVAYSAIEIFGKYEFSRVV
jgi:hypothetical protein